MNPSAAADEPAASDGVKRWVAESVGGLGRVGRMGWRLRVLVLWVFLGCVALFLLVRSLAHGLHLDIAAQARDSAGLEIVSTGHAELSAKLATRIVAVRADGLPRLAATATLLRPTPRWAVRDVDCQAILTQQQLLSKQLQASAISLDFDDGSAVTVTPKERGFGGLGTMFWLLSALALTLYLFAAVVLLSRPGLKNLLYAVMALAQSGNLLMMAIESITGMGLPVGFALLDFRLRTLFDLVTAAAAVHVALIHPRHLPGAWWWSNTCWCATMAYAALAMNALLPHMWWWTQLILIGHGLVMLFCLSWTIQHDRHPTAQALLRLSVAGTGTLMLLTLAIAMSGRHVQDQHLITAIGSVIWYVFFASLLLLVPFLSRSQNVMREFALLAGLSTVATSLDLLFITVFALGQFTSLTLALFTSIGLYVGARHWLITHFTGTGHMSAERTFECLYRAARAIEAAPQDVADPLAKLLIELFDPLELRRDPRCASSAVVTGGGTLLAVPILDPRLQHSQAADPGAGTLVLLHARRGRRLFTSEDARLANRVLHQLQTAVAYDHAVEQGRHEERTRLAQDLHDDIGARLLTLMYKAPNPEMEEYVRHTLQDLKTLTRGLAASEHWLSHAAAEWKTDITQRLAASHATLDWTFQALDDVKLSVVQWSGLTRILRELVNNVIAHANATQVEITGQFEDDKLRLSVADDGDGHHPQTWAHGLGLGGVRKRTKLLGGQVRWIERQPRGIACEVSVPLIKAKRP